MPSSLTRKREREKRRAERERLEEKKRTLQAVPEPEPEPEGHEINFLLYPDGLMMPDRRTAPYAKSLIVPAPLNAHLQRFQSRHSGSRYKVQKGSLALWRMLMREEQAAVDEAMKEAARTGLPPEPQWGPLMRAFLAEAEIMAAEASGDIFDEE